MTAARAAANIRDIHPCNNAGDWTVLGFTDYPAIFEELNQQHRQIDAEVDELEKLLGGRDLARAREVMETLLKTLRRHFRHEQKIMRKYAYPYGAQHKAHHEESLDKIEAFLRAFDDHCVVELAEKYAKLYRAQLEEDVKMDKGLGEFLHLQQDYKGHSNAWWSSVDPRGPYGF